LARLERPCPAASFADSVNSSSLLKDDSVDESFDVQSLARFLHLPPEQVQKMAERGKLPGRKLGGQWRFDRAEIFHWFEDRIGLSGDVELQKVEQVLDSAAKKAITDTVSLRQLLNESLVWLDCPSRNKNSLISDFCQRIADTGRLWLPAEMSAAIRSREELHPTAMENGAALLHPRRPQPTYFDEPFVAIAITPSGIPCGGPKGALTDIFFLLASSDDAFHLRLLARISRLVNQAELLQRLRAAQSPAEVCAELYAADEQLS
jgi:PTS system nitrogen regulatory IIA component